MSGPFEPQAGYWQQAGAAPARGYEQSPYQQQYDQPGQHPQHSYPLPAQVPMFQVTTMTHTGALVFWFNQRHTVRGTYAQCDAALRSAQAHNLALGWWSFVSILLMNWIAISHNSSACKKLDYDAAQAQAYAQWWYQYIAPAHGQRLVTQPLSGPWGPPPQNQQWLAPQPPKQGAPWTWKWAVVFAGEIAGAAVEVSVHPRAAQ